MEWAYFLAEYSKKSRVLLCTIPTQNQLHRTVLASSFKKCRRTKQAARGRQEARDSVSLATASALIATATATTSTAATTDSRAPAAPQSPRRGPRLLGVSRRAPPTLARSRSPPHGRGSAAWATEQVLANTCGCWGSSGRFRPSRCPSHPLNASWGDWPALSWSAQPHPGRTSANVVFFGPGGAQIAVLVNARGRCGSQSRACHRHRPSPAGREAGSTGRPFVVGPALTRSPRDPGALGAKHPRRQGRDRRSPLCAPPATARAPTGPDCRRVVRAPCRGPTGHAGGRPAPIGRPSGRSFG